MLRRATALKRICDRQRVQNALRISLDKNEQIFYIINGDSIPKNRKCEYTNKAQTIAVWAFSNFVRNLRTTICKKSINTLRQIMDRIFHKTDCATLTIFWGMYSLAKVTTWQSSSIGCFFVAHF